MTLLFSILMALGLGLGIHRSKAGGGFNPATDSRVVAWYEETGIVRDGTDVQGWTDSVGSNDMTSDLGSPLPQFGAADLNSHSTVIFLGLGEELRKATAISGITTAATMYIVGKKDAVSDGGFYAQGFASGNHHPFTDGVVYDGFCTSTRKTCGTPSPATEGGWHIWGFHSGASDYRVEIDGSQLFTTSTNTFAAGSRFAVGCGSDDGTTAGFRLSGAIAEVIILNQILAAGDRAKVLAYLESRFAL